MTHFSQSADLETGGPTRAAAMEKEQSLSAGNGWCSILVLLYIVGGSRGAGLMDNRRETVDRRKVGMLSKGIEGVTRKRGGREKVIEVH